MLPPFDYFDHRRACTFKQNQRNERFAALPDDYSGPLTSTERSILSTPIGTLVSQVQDGTTDPKEILRTYGKTVKAVQAHTNCVTEIMVPDGTDQWLANGEINLKGPLAGIPVSLKDSINVRGYDTSVGYSKYTNNPLASDGVVVKLLKKAGAIPHVKTALPITLLSFESTNSLWGIAKNPHNTKYSPGGSTGGEGAILAMNGSRIGIGSDVAGSVRAPAAWSGIFSLRCSTGRWPKVGVNTSMPGQEGIPSVFSPMARTLDDLTYFTKSFISMKPWEVDYTCHPIPWRQEAFDAVTDKKTLRIGVMRTDGVVRPAPAIARALEATVSALRSQGHSIVELDENSFPSTATPLDALRIASTLLCADGGQMYSSFFRTGESNDKGAAQLYFYGHTLPKPFKYLYYLYVRYIKRDAVWASLLKDFSGLSAYQNWQWVAKRELFRAQWFEWLNEPAQSFDVLLTPVNATPALPHGCMHDAVSSCGYTFLWNLLDYAAGVIPVTKVDKVKDALPKDFKAANGVEKGAYKYYDSEQMEGLPCAVQVLAGLPRRLCEESTLAAMKVVSDALESQGVVYEHLDVEKFID